MSRLIDLNFNPDKRILKQFGFIALVGFGVLAALAFTRSFLFSGLGSASDTVGYALLAVGGVSFLFSLLAPGLNRGLYVLMTLVAYPIGVVMSYLIMGTLFFLIIAPIAIIMKIIGFDPMNRRYDARATSYFANARSARSKESYFRQY